MDTLETGSAYSGCSFMAHSFVNYSWSLYELMSTVPGLGMENVELLTAGNCQGGLYLSWLCSVTDKYLLG